MAATLALRICANFLDIRYIKAARGSLSNGELRFSFYNANAFASAMKISMLFLFWGFRNARTIGGIDFPQASLYI